MKHTTPRSSHLPTPYEAIALALVVLLLLPACSRAQAQLHADKQILLESTHGTVALKKGLGDQLYVLNRSIPSSIWVSDYSGTSMHRIVNGGSDPTDVRFPKDLAVGRDGNVVVVDGNGLTGLIKVFSGDGRLFNSFPVARPQSVGVLSDGRILVSGIPKDHLISIFDQQGRMVGNMGEPAEVDDAILNIGSIVVDGDDNIYYVFRFLLTPAVRKYTLEGKLVAEWHPKSAFLDQAVVHAKKTYEERKEKWDHGVNPVLTAAAYDSETKTLWVASGSQVMQLGSSGETIRSLELVTTQGVPIQTDGLLVDRDFIRAATNLHGTFEFFKPH